MNKVAKFILFLSKHRSVVVAIILVGLLYILCTGCFQYDSSNQEIKNDVKVENNSVLENFYSPFKITYEFDLTYEGEGTSGEFDIALNYGGNTAESSFRPSFKGLTLNKGETKHGIITFSTYKADSGPKRHRYAVYIDGTKIGEDEGKNYSKLNNFDVGFSINNSAIKINNANYHRGGIIFSYEMFPLLFLYLIILGIVFVPRIERRIIGKPDDLSKIKGKLILFTVVDVVAFIILLLTDTIVGRGLVEVFGFDGLRNFGRENFILFAIVSLVVLFFAFMWVPIKYEGIRKITIKEFFTKDIPFFLVHALLVLIVLWIFALIIAFVKFIWGIIICSLFGVFSVGREMTVLTDQEIEKGVQFKFWDWH